MKSVQNSKAFEIIKLVLRHLENETMELARRSLILKLTSIFSFLPLFSHILRNYLQIHFYTFLWGHVGFLFFTLLCTSRKVSHYCSAASMAVAYWLEGYEAEIMSLDRGCVLA